MKKKYLRLEHQKPKAMKLARLAGVVQLSGYLTGSMSTEVPRLASVPAIGLCWSLLAVRSRVARVGDGGMIFAGTAGLGRDW